MTTSNTREPTRVLLRLGAGEGALLRLEAALAAASFASVIVAPTGERPLGAADAAPLVAAGQKAGAAVLIEGDPGLARTLGADGVHLPPGDKPVETYAAVRALLGGRVIVGADAGRSRHDAMGLGEASADYVAFGIPAFVKDRKTAFGRQLELIAWWAEIFEVPCVAMDAGSVGEAMELAGAGADFVCLTLAGGMPLAAVEAEVRAWEAAVAATAGPASVD